MQETQIDECYRLLPDEYELVLPPKYAALKEIFNCVEVKIRDLVRKKEMAVYKDLKRTVRNKTERRFTKQHLAMIKTIYPDAFDLRYELMRRPHSGQYQNVELFIDLSKSHCTNIYERERIFHALLLNQAKFAHHDFLQTLDPPVFEPLDEMICWHPQFDLNSVPDIVPEPIPLPADDGSPVMRTFLKRMMDREVTATERMEKSFASLLVKSAPRPQVFIPYFECVLGLKTWDEMLNERTTLPMPPMPPLGEEQIQEMLDGYPRFAPPRVEEKLQETLDGYRRFAPPRVEEEVIAAPVN